MRRPLSVARAASRGAALSALVLAVALAARAPRRRPEVDPSSPQAMVLSPRVGKYDVPVDTLPPREAAGERALRVLVLGDSGAKFLGAQMRHTQRDGLEMVAERGVGSCSLLLGADRALDDGGVERATSCADRWVKDVRELRPDVTLVVLGGAFLTERACDDTFEAAYAARLDALLAAMGASAGRVVLARIPLPMGRWRWGDVEGRVRCLNTLLDAAAARHGLSTVDLHRFVCPSLACDDARAGAPMRPDGLHFDGAGGRVVARFVWDEIERLVASVPGGSASP